MTDPKRVGDLELVEDIRFQEREWKVQRVGWVAMFLLIALAMLGLFSTGPLSSAEGAAVSASGELRVGYQRFIRHDGRTTVTVEADSGLADAGQLELWVSQGWLDAHNVQGISPQPDEVRDAGDRQIFVFFVDDPSSPVTVEFDMRPQTMGRVSGEVGVGGGPAFSFDQFSYP